MSAPKLNRCLHCGSSNVGIKDTSRPVAWVACDACGATGPPGKSNINPPKDAWNHPFIAKACENLGETCERDCHIHIYQHEGKWCLFDADGETLASGDTMLELLFDLQDRMKITQDFHEVSTWVPDPDPGPGWGRIPDDTELVPYDEYWSRQSLEWKRILVSGGLPHPNWFYRRRIEGMERQVSETSSTESSSQKHRNDNPECPLNDPRWNGAMSPYTARCDCYDSP